MLQRFVALHKGLSRDRNSDCDGCNPHHAERMVMALVSIKEAIRFIGEYK
jgi:hypothetical protein